MFRSVVVKLTLWYVGALVLVCLLFSVPAYNIASARLRRGAERQTDVIRHLPGSFPAGGFVSQLELQRELQLQEDRRQLLRALAFFNLALIASGSLASYWFARRTLVPIETAHEAQSRFAADASHELRTPLATMKAEIDVALRDKKLTTAQAREILSSNLEEIAHLQRLSEQLLSLTRMQTPLAGTKLNLTKLIQAEITKLEAQYHIAIKLGLAKHVMIQGDEALLAELLRILVDNAVVYSAPADPQLVVSLRKVGQQARWSIKDHGPGIDPKEQSKVFERFYRGRNATTAGISGHGLGLALAQKIAISHGGEITLSSQPTKGSTFTVVLPLV